ncbi:MAG: ThuA domain-containing protein [Thermoguttaceae bacterium]
MPRVRILGLLTLLAMATIAAPTALAAPASDSPSAPRLRVLIVDGMNNHDWPRATRILEGILDRSGLFAVDVSTSPAADAPEAAWERWQPRFSDYSVVVSNFNGGHTASGRHWPRSTEKALEDYVSGGGGLVIYHSANNSFPAWPAYNEMIGLGWRDRDFGPGLIVTGNEQVAVVPKGSGRDPGHGPEHDFQVTVLDGNHPITRGLPKRWMHPQEQLTHGQHGPARNMTVLTYAFSKDTGENEVMDWVVPYGQGRVYVTMLGHLWKDKPDTAMRCVGFQTLLVRGCQWAATGEATYPVGEDFPTADAIKLEAEASLRRPEDRITGKKWRNPHNRGGFLESTCWSREALRR